MANTTEATTTDWKKNLSFEEGWPILQEAINKVIEIAEGVPHRQFTSEEYMRIYTVVYELCKFNPHGPEPEKLYEQYQKIFEDYVSSKVLPHLRGKNGEILLKELAQQWVKYRTMKRWLFRFFLYLDRYFVPLKKLPSLEQTSHLVFYRLVYGEMNDQVRDAVISLIDREREGEKIDQALVRSVLDIYVEMAEDSVKYYEKDFETAMLADTAQFYSRKTLGWISTDSYEAYILKVEDCLKQEKAKVTTYLRRSSMHKLMEVVEHELLTAPASKLEEMKKIDGKAA